QGTHLSEASRVQLAQLLIFRAQHLNLLCLRVLHSTKPIVFALKLRVLVLDVFQCPQLLLKVLIFSAEQRIDLQLPANNSKQPDDQESPPERSPNSTALFLSRHAGAQVRGYQADAWSRLWPLLNLPFCSGQREIKAHNAANRSRCQRNGTSPSINSFDCSSPT